MSASIHSASIFDLEGRNPQTYPLTNGFSLNMLVLGLAYGTTVHVVPLSPEDVRGLPLKSYIGHADTAHIVADMLDRPDLSAPNRSTLHLLCGDSIVVAQYLGPRLPEGATILPEGAKIEFVLVSIGRYRPTVKTIDFYEGFTGDVVHIPQVVFPDREAVGFPI